MNLPSAGTGNLGGRGQSNRLGNAAAGFGGALAGGAAAEFLSNRPSNALPGEGARPGGGDFASQLPAAGRGDGIGPSGGRPDVGGPGTPGDRPGDIGRPGQPGNRPGDIGRPGNPGNRPGDIGRPGTPGNRPGDIGRPGRPFDHAQNLPNRIADRGQWQNWRNEHRNDIGDYWRNNGGNFGDWYGDRWWNDNHVNWPYYPGFGYWGAAAWAPLSGWVDYGWSDPVYYDYGENVYYQDGSVYYGDQPVATEAEYAQQAEAIALDVPETKPAAKDWMPLGVFALTSSGQPTGADPTMFLQLAVSKQGVISGTFQNTATDTVKAVEGMVDKETQRAAWTAAGETRPLMEVGIGNLTKDTAPALVHFPDGSTQQVLMVRVDKPQAK
jgi:hypothetical protein